MKGHFSSSPIDRNIADKIIDTISESTSPKINLLHLAEDDNAFKQLLKTINTEEKMVAEIIANERFPNIHTNAEINKQLAEAGLPAVRANVQLYLEKLGLSEADKRRSIAERAILSDFFKSNTPDKNLTDEEVAKLTGISTDNIQAYKHSWLKKFAKKITQDSGYNSHTAQQIQNQLLTQEGIFIPQQTITNYLHNNNLESAFKEVIADEEPHNPYYDPEIAARVSSKTEIEVTARYVAKLRKQLGIANATERKDLERLKNAVISVVIEANRDGLYDSGDSEIYSELIRKGYKLRDSTEVTRLRTEAGISRRWYWNEVLAKLGEQAKARLEPAIMFIIANENPQNPYYDDEIITILLKNKISVPSFFIDIDIREFFGLPNPSYVRYDATARHDASSYKDVYPNLPPDIIVKSSTKRSKILKKF